MITERDWSYIVKMFEDENDKEDIKAYFRKTVCPFCCKGCPLCPIKIHLGMKCAENGSAYDLVDRYLFTKRTSVTRQMAYEAALHIKTVQETWGK